MPPKPQRVYWDASVFLSLFQRGSTPDLQYQREQAILLIEEARKGETLIITSTFTLAEARRGDGVPPLPGDEHATLNAFFKHTYIEVVPVDRAIVSGVGWRLLPRGCDGGCADPYREAEVDGGDAATAGRRSNRWRRRGQIDRSLLSNGSTRTLVSPQTYLLRMQSSVS